MLLPHSAVTPPAWEWDGSGPRLLFPAPKVRKEEGTRTSRELCAPGLSSNGSGASGQFTTQSLQWCWVPVKMEEGPTVVAVEKSQHRSPTKHGFPTFAAGGEPRARAGRGCTRDSFTQAPFPTCPVAPSPHGGSVTFTAASLSLEEGGWTHQPQGRAAVSSKPRSKPSAPVPERQRPALARTGVVLSSSPPRRNGNSNRSLGEKRCFLISFHPLGPRRYD